MKLAFLNQALKVAKNSLPVILLVLIVQTVTNYKPSWAEKATFYSSQDKEVSATIASTPSNLSNQRVLVVIDPGHGGKDVGTTISSNGLVEKDVVLPISTKLAKILQKNGIKVIMTRKKDSFVSLEDRVNIAQQANATLFVTIHANSTEESPNINGLETYFFDKPENRRLAKIIHKNILQNVNIADRGIRPAQFYLLRTTTIPSVHIEAGYLSGKNDAPKLANPRFRDQMADAIARGILQYLKTSR